MGIIVEIMFGSRGEFMGMSNGKLPGVRMAMVVTSTLLVLVSVPFPVAALISRHVQPTAQFVFTVVAPNVWNCVTPSCIYLLLNVLILALGLQSGVLTARPSTDFIKPDADADVDHSHEFIKIPTSSIGCGNVSKSMTSTSDCKANECSDPMKDMKIHTTSIVVAGEESSKTKEVDPVPSGGLYRKKSRCRLLRRSTTGLSNLSRESTQLTPRVEVKREMVLFEICAEQGDEVAEEEHKVRRREGGLSSEELYAKAESFIGNFYTELKMQRENSWKRLCNMYRQSC